MIRFRFLWWAGALLGGCVAAPAPNPELEPGYAAARFQPGFAEVSHLRPPPDGGTGKQLYVRNCLSCHGLSGQGDGSIARSLMPRPRNLTLPQTYKYGSGPLAIFRSVKYGLDGTTMGPWKGRMTDAEMWEVTHYVSGLQQQPRKGALEPR